MMNNAILAVSWFLARTLNAGIVILAVIEAVLMIMAYNKMILLKKRIDALNGETPGKQVLRSKKAGIVETEYTVKVKKDWKEFDNFCDDYQNDSMLFSSVSLIIGLERIRQFLRRLPERLDAVFLSIPDHSDLPSAGYTGNGHRSVRSDERKRGLVQRAESL